tara:strand:- start:6585 stop:7340 length:756 start_codon:yes stop_codon:yes gene_type:complete
MNIVNILKSKNFPNLLICKSSEKDFDLNNIYNIYYSKVFNENNIQFKKINNYFYFKNINNKNFQNFKKTLDNIILTNDFYINEFKLIIIENINLSELNQKILKNIIDKNILVRYLVIINNINKIIINLKSIFLVLNYKNYKENLIIKNVIYNNDLYNDITNYLIKLLSNELNINNFKNIKNVSYILILNNISIYYLIKIILEFLIKNNHNKISKFIKFSSEIEKYYKNNYLRLFYYEYILIRTNKLINSST